MQPPMDRANVPVRTSLTAWRQAADNLRSRKCGAGHGEVFGFTGAAGRSQLAVVVRRQRGGDGPGPLPGGGLLPVEAEPAASPPRRPNSTQAGEPRVQVSSGSGRRFPKDIVPSARDGDGDGDGDGVVCER